MKKVVVIGAGTMGAGIAQTFAVSGLQVVLKDVAQEAVERGIATIEKGLS
ncbi:3-hydroxyacyl-CoA dehydrogenase NAD-binding domain-containing protein, partial [Oleiphilus sp. HI0080]